MSAVLLQKSLKLFEEGIDTKNRGSKKAGLHSKRKKQLSSSKLNKELNSKEENIKKNLLKLQLLQSNISLEVSKQVFTSSKIEEPIIKEEATAFTEKDFTEFEKDYIVS